MFINEGLVPEKKQIEQIYAHDNVLRNVSETYNPSEPFGINNINLWFERFNIERSGKLFEIVQKYPILVLGLGRWENGEVKEGTGVLTAPKDELRKHWPMMVHSVNAAAHIEFLAESFRTAPSEVFEKLTELKFHGNTFKKLSPAVLRDAALVSHFWEIRASQRYSPGIAWMQRGPDFVEYLRFLKSLGLINQALEFAQDAEQMNKVSKGVRQEMLKFGHVALMCEGDWATKEKPMSTVQSGIILADAALHGVSLGYLPELSAARTRFKDAIEVVHPGLLKEMEEAPKPPWAGEMLAAYDALYTQ